MEILNQTEKAVDLSVRVVTPKAPKRTATITVRARGTRTVDLLSITRRDRLNKLVKEGQLAIEPAYDFGPVTGQRAAGVGSYGSEDVYICFECGGPIVFRGSPPTPIHV